MHVQGWQARSGPHRNLLQQAMLLADMLCRMACPAGWRGPYKPGAAVADASSQLRVRRSCNRVELHMQAKSVLRTSLQQLKKGSMSKCSRRRIPSENSSNSTEKAPSMGAQATSSIGRTVSPSVASKKVAPLAFSLQRHNQQGHQQRSMKSNTACSLLVTGEVYTFACRIPIRRHQQTLALCRCTSPLLAQKSHYAGSASNEHCLWAAKG